MIGDGKTGEIDEIKKTNKPTLNDEVTNALRDITEKRASTLTYMLDKASEDDVFAKAAVRQYGIDNGKDLRESLQNPDDLQEFAEKFTGGLESNVYEMETIKATENEFELHFHYCPYVNRWLRMKKSSEEMSRLCDICMEGDKAVTENFSNLQFELGETIAKGGNYCKIRYVKN
ncbi:L-2-amino-thiazoline-4-carboxylic acid hydrolase [Ligilactobacillus sp. WILCCON 0076]|uniref:L-2-amino-thiazoline-4-carboxylic acid hydrolase n=1 Tax=Ligilactobacillus ubinensis TaxID=2876789 RepID=A0A9X2JJP9_9LACO|nr:L-2-amino-thiazoline-4-carboxylic acid hydrolase [Ligilactobacillus ubinensis]MCP0885762.1 L-2-amino-thiazoline-4-carboxylic acid hydrolase [Ligilactobacillus ubinensis]